MFNRFEALKNSILNGQAEFGMMLADFHLGKGTITQEEFDTLNAMAYPLPADGDGNA